MAVPKTLFPRLDTLICSTSSKGSILVVRCIIYFIVFT
jgi:hypothetical protein